MKNDQTVKLDQIWQPYCFSYHSMLVDNITFIIYLLLEAKLIGKIM